MSGALSQVTRALSENHERAVGGRAVAKRPQARPRSVPRGYESVDGIILTEPRIDAIRRELQALLEVIELESGGEPIDVDGFRLRNLEDWSDFPTSLSDIFWHLSSVCNFRCEFCYEKGNPEDFPIQNLTRMASLSEIDTRLKYYDVERQRGIFSVRTAINEPFVNKNAVEVLRRIRQKNPNELISFVTNGSLLGEEALDAIAELNPVFFNLSLYSVDREVRQRVLGDARPDAAVETVAHLNARKIPYMANLVMWPSIPFEDMFRTIRYLDEHRAVLIRICLGGYSRYLEGQFPRFSAEEYWPKVVEAVEAIRPDCRTPLLIEPNNFVRRDDAPLLDGVVRNSPADLAGLCRNDEILAVDGKLVRTRMQLLSAVRSLVDSGGGRFHPPGVSTDTGPIPDAHDRYVELLVQRDGRQFSVSLQRYQPSAMESYPYASIAAFGDFIFGLVITDGLRYSVLKDARAIIEREGAARTLILSSTMMQPIVETMCQRSNAFGGLNVVVSRVENRYFGGTINIGDLLVVSDFVAAIREFQDEHGPVDLVLVPSSPFATSPWQRDLRGVTWTEIERQTGVPTRLVHCPTITF